MSRVCNVKFFGSHLADIGLFLTVFIWVTVYLISCFYDRLPDLELSLFKISCICWCDGFVSVTGDVFCPQVSTVMCGLPVSHELQVFSCFVIRLSRKGMMLFISNWTGSCDRSFRFWEFFWFLLSITYY